MFFLSYIKTYRHVFAFKLPQKLTSSTWTAMLSRTWGTKKKTQTEIKQRNWYWLLLWTHNTLWIIFAHKSFSLYAFTKFSYCFLRVLRWIGWFVFLVHSLLDLLLNQRPVVSVCMCVGKNECSRSNVISQPPKIRKHKIKMKRFTMWTMRTAISVEASLVITYWHYIFPLNWNFSTWSFRKISISFLNSNKKRHWHSSYPISNRAFSFYPRKKRTKIEDINNSMKRNTMKV